MWAYYDFEPYVEDDWKARPNMTISAGLRFETQNHIGDHADFAPRVGIAWGLGKGKSAKTVLRAGAGVFYDRFAENYILNAERLNGINQQQYIVPSPDFYPDVPPVSTLSAALLSPAIYQIAPNLRTPYTTQSGIGLERQVTKIITASVTYLNTHGVHQLVTRDINAPDPVNPGDARPNPSLSDLYQYESAGLYNQNQLIANFNVRASKVSLFGFYTLSYVDSNTAGGGSFPMNQYDLEEDYGRAAYDRAQPPLPGWQLEFAARGFNSFPLSWQIPLLPLTSSSATTWAAESTFPPSMPALPLPRVFPIPPMWSAPAGAPLTPCPFPARRSSPSIMGPATTNSLPTFASVKPSLSVKKCKAREWWWGRRWTLWPGPGGRRAQQHGQHQCI